MIPSAPQFLVTCPQHIRSTFREMLFKPDELILIQGDAPEGVYILLEGEAGVYQLTMNGIVYQAYVYTDGELFGEIEALNGRPVVSNVRADQPCRALRIGRAEFLEWMKADPEFGLFVSQQLAEKLYRASVTSVTHIAYPLKYRVLFFLWNASRQGDHYIRKEDAIAGLGSNERSINRILKDLTEDGLVETDRGIIHIVSAEKIVEEMSRYE